MEYIYISQLVRIFLIKIAVNKEATDPRALSGKAEVVTFNVIRPPSWHGQPLQNVCVCVCVCACACACACACVCQRWLRICAICRSHHHALISSSMIYHTIWFLKMLLTCDLSRCWPFWLGSLVLLRHKWPRICSTCCKHFPVLSPFMIYHRVCN